MKTIKIIFLAFLFSIGINSSFAQIVVKSDGNVVIGDDVAGTHTLEVNSATTPGEVKNVTFGGSHVLDINAGETFGSIWSTTNHSYDWGQNIVSVVNRYLTVSYVMKKGTEDVFYVQGDGWAYAKMGLYTSSDRRLKEDIKNIDGALDKIRKLNGCSYKRIQDPNANPSDKISNQRELGLIAQDVELVVPEVVGSTKDGIKVIAYQNLIPLLIEAIKEQQDQIDQLKSANGINNNIDPMILQSAILYQNSPNPFNQNTVISFFLPQTVKSATLIIYDMSGIQIKSISISQRDKGSETINASELHPGMFMYTLIADGKEVDTKRMILTQ